VIGVTLLQLQRRFATEEDCETFLRRVRWPEGVRCPRCGTANPYYTAGLAKWECRSCRRQFTLTSGTVFHGTRTPLLKWFIAIWLVCSSKRGISGKQLQRILGVTYKTAWRMAMQIRLAMLHGSFEENLCAVLAPPGDGRSEQAMWGRTGRGLVSRCVVFDLTAFNKEHRAIVVGDLRAQELQEIVAATMRFGADLRLSDQPHGKRTSPPRGRRTGRHDTLTFISGCVHGGGTETPASLLKRAVFGVYHRLSSKYLAAYLGEFAFRFSHRHDDRLFENVLAYCWQ